MNNAPLAPEEPLSPELVLVLSPELRAQVLAGLPAPVWATPRRRAVPTPAPSDGAPFEPSLGRILVTRIAHLVLIFIVLTILTLAMSVVAQAVR